MMIIAPSSLKMRSAYCHSQWAARSDRRAGFTLVELMLSMTILTVLMLVVVNVIGVVQQQWIRSSSRVTSFREARMAFDLLNRNISQATLNTYWANESELVGRDAANQDLFKFKNYVRQSELQFVCGKTAGLLTAAAGNALSYPAHGIFFQAPLGTANIEAGTGANVVNTENMTGLLCGRGYFVSWGDDSGFRPAFLNGMLTVPSRFRYRLMEYCPTAESNRIYYDATAGNDLSARRPITERPKQWFDDALVNVVKDGETASTRAFTRPVADNIIALIISPQLEASSGSVGVAPESIAPLYEYDSTLVSNPGATSSSAANPQGTRHLLPPLLKITMIALDSAAGELMAETGREELQMELASTMAGLFGNAVGYNGPSSNYRSDLEKVESYLRDNKLNYRIFTSTITMKQGRWSK